jgi:hypothetical protein
MMNAPAGSHATAISPIHLAIRFGLELALAAGFALWGWHVGDGGLSGFLAATLLFIAFWAIWGIFGTPGDPSRGRAIVEIPGWTRLLLEAGLIGLCAYGVWTSWSRAASETLLTALALHYAVTWERSRWLLRSSVASKE